MDSFFPKLTGVLEVLFRLHRLLVLARQPLLDFFLCDRIVKLNSADHIR